MPDPNTANNQQRNSAWEPRPPMSNPNNQIPNHQQNGPPFNRPHMPDPNTANNQQRNLAWEPRPPMSNPNNQVSNHQQKQFQQNGPPFSTQQQPNNPGFSPSNSNANNLGRIQSQPPNRAWSAPPSQNSAPNWPSNAPIPSANSQRPNTQTWQNSHSQHAPNAGQNIPNTGTRSQQLDPTWHNGNSPSQQAANARPNVPPHAQQPVATRQNNHGYPSQQTAQTGTNTNPSGSPTPPGERGLTSTHIGNHNPGNQVSNTPLVNNQPIKIEPNHVVAQQNPNIPF